jgi:hypothetical protein
MIRLYIVLQSTAAICAFASSTSAVAQEPITGSPKATAPITSEPPNTPSHRPGNSYDPFGALRAIFASRFDATTGRSADTTEPKARCQVILDFNDAEARPTTVCDP